MIIPTTTQSINIGDKVITIREFKDTYYIITPGHEFNVIDYDKIYAKFICEDPINNLIVNFSKHDLVKKIDLKSAKKEYIFNQETSKYKEYIYKKCPNTDFGYDDRGDTYNICKLKKENRDSYCYPNLECAKFLKKEDINKCSELLKHLRYVKIDKLNKINK